MFRLSSSRTGSRHAGHMTFHRIDSKLIKSPSVGVPWRLIIPLLAGIFLVVAGYSSIDLLPADTLIDRAVQLLDRGGQDVPLQVVSDLTLRR